MLKHPDLIVIGGGLAGMEAAWQAAQHGDYINYPLTIAEYGRFFDTLLSAECIDLRTFETEIKRGVNAGARHFFDGCLPLEIIARCSRQALSFGPMQPTGMVEPHTGCWLYAIAQ